MRQTTYGSRPALLVGAALAALAVTACSSPAGGPTASPTLTSSATRSTGPSTSTSSPSTSSSTSSSSSPAPSSPSPTRASPTSMPGSFGSEPVSGGGSGAGQSTLLTVRIGSHTGYDRLVLTFGGDPVPEFTVTPQRTATFPTDPSDEPVTLRGQTGVRVVVRSTLLAPKALVDDMRPGFPAIREVQQIGNVEAVVSYAVGVGGSPALVRVSTLSSPNRLVIDVAWPSPE